MLLFNLQQPAAGMQMPYFNTSNVTIQLRKFDCITVSIVISIHLMLLFNLKLADILTVPLSHFNTSNVTIQQKKQLLKHLQNVHFNTSNVTIQLHVRSKVERRYIISIHLMLLFNRYDTQ